MLSWRVSAGGGGRGPVEQITPSVWEGGGGGGEGVARVLPPDLATTEGEQGGVGSFGFRFLVTRRGKVFFSDRI